jgi:hypothetical protein
VCLFSRQKQNGYKRKDETEKKKEKENILA